MKKAKVTIKDVAKLAGVSPSTVSMILNDYKTITFSEETRVRVLEACETLGYYGSARGRVEESSKQLLLIACPSLKNPHYIKGIDSAQQRAEELGYETIVFCTRRSKDEEQKLVRLCKQMKVAGVLLLYQPDNIAAYELLRRENHIVQIYDKSGSTDVNIMELDNIKIGRMVAEHLIDLGHQAIAHISLPLVDTQPSRARRIEGIRSYMQEIGLDPDECLRISTVETEQLNVSGKLEGYETGYLIAGHLLDINAPITAFSAHNDMLAYGIMDAIYERKKRIPQDYSVCGCDNLPTSAYQKIALTSVELFTEEKVRDAVDVLVQKIQSKENSGTDLNPVRITRIEYSPQLVVRKSTGKRLK